MVAEKNAGKREFIGLVTSDKMDKTIVVQVTTRMLLEARNTMLMMN